MDDRTKIIEILLERRKNLREQITRLNGGYTKVMLRARINEIGQILDLIGYVEPEQDLETLIDQI